MGLLGFLLMQFLLTAALGLNTTDPSCETKCGNLSIPYPFGVRQGCYFKDASADYLIVCNTTFDPPKAFLGEGNIDVVDISLNGEIRIRNLMGYECYNESGSKTDKWTNSFTIRSPQYSFSHTKNRFWVVGCDTTAFFETERGASGCISYCTNLQGMENGSCSGVGCCSTSITKGLKNFSTNIGTYYNYNNSKEFNLCGYMFVAEDSQYNFSISDLNDKKLRHRTFPIVLDWSVGNQTCEQAKTPLPGMPYACRSRNSQCNNSTNRVGYLCQCSPGYQGNPYVVGGCKDIDECKNNSTICPREAQCNNTQGDYDCLCPEGQRFNRSATTCDGGPTTAKGASTKDSVPLSLKLGIGSAVGFLILLATITSLCWGVQRKKLANQDKKIQDLKNKMFEQNGGPLLVEYFSSQPANAFRIFTEEELSMATDDFNKGRVIGEGGHGVVYRGMLENDKPVAIKKSKKMDEREKDEFVREMTILSQINHVHVVKIVGCCLEVEIPMLVYENVPGGTLFDLLHPKGQQQGTLIPLETRLRIAAEVAEALAYLHSYASPPILHKDVKTANILLDENQRAKVSDFGASVVAPADGLAVATMVQGTLGYLDPEVIQSYQFTEKSDVYSFGMVLVELLTGKKPFEPIDTETKRSLAGAFVSALRGNRLVDILESTVCSEEEMEILLEVSELACRCLSVNGADRPTMKEVVTALHVLRTSRDHPWALPCLPQEAESLLGEREPMAYTTSDLGTTVSHIGLEIEAGR